MRGLERVAESGCGQLPREPHQDRADPEVEGSLGLLGDCAYGDDTAFRLRLHESGLEYVLAVSPDIGVFGPETTFAVPERRPGRGRPPSVARPDRKPESVRAIAQRLPADAWQTVPCRTTPAGEIVESRFAFVRVVAAHAVTDDHKPARWEWLIIEWPADHDAPTGHWLSNKPEDTAPERLARLARLRRVLASGRGPAGRLRALWALPPWRA